MHKTTRLLLIFLCSFSCISAQKNASTSGKEFDKYFDSIRKVVHDNFFNNPTGVKKDALLLVKIAKSIKQKENALHLLGYVYDLTGNVDSARYCLENRLKITKKYFLNTTSHYQAIIDYTNWGMEYVDSTLLTELLTTALPNVDKIKNKREYALMCVLLGDIFLKNKDYKKSEFYYDKSFKMLTGKYSKSDYYERMGKLNIAKNNFEQAKDDFSKAIHIINNKTNFATVGNLNYLGYVHYRLKKFQTAKKILNESSFLQKKYDYSYLKSNTYLYLSYLEKESKNYNNEKKYLDSAKFHYDGDLNFLKDLNLAYADYYSRTNNFDKEKQFSNLYNTTLDSINNAESLKTRLSLESLYELKENKKELYLQKKILEKESLLKKVYLFSSFILLLLGVGIVWVLYKKFKTQKQLNKNQYHLHEQTLKLMQENQRTEIIKEKIKAKIEERGKLSLELHDGIASEIGALKLTISDGQQLDKDNIDSLIVKIDKLYNEVRNLSHDLDPDNIAFVEFSQLVNNLCLMTEKSGLKTAKNIFISRRIDELDEKILVNIYRVLQEAINNTIKHAFATEVQIDVIETEEELYFAVKDNGKGFGNSSTKPGIGLKNIQKRVNSLNGICDITNSSLGTTVAIRIPKNQWNFKIA
ncbi:MAG: hypothetical protein QM535_06415 [Limnohabitans sp.]|nr:hypothetical protein [Limnohabitans sp.]